MTCSASTSPTTFFFARCSLTRQPDSSMSAALTNSCNAFADESGILPSAKCRRSLSPPCPRSDARASRERRVRPCCVRRLKSSSRRPLADMLNAKLDLMPENAPSLRSHILIANHEMRPLAARALYWEAEDTLLVADLHFEKGAAFAALGMLLPPYDTRTTLERVHKVICAVEPSRIVSLGHSFHRSNLSQSLAEDDLAMLTRLQQGREWYWICGNHDPHLPACIGGTICTT